MSDYGLGDSPTSQQHHGSDANLNNTSLDDPNAANNSIIGKVKSRVSSILPNSISKWFSPSSKLQNDTLNGSATSTANVSRRRRRIEVEEDDESCEEHDVQRCKYEENHNLLVKENNSEVEDDEEDDESQNSEEEYNATLAAQTGRHAIHGRQPPAKRSRLNVDNRDSPYIAPRQPLISSTPSIGSTFTRSSIGTTSAGTRSSYQRFTNLNLYSNLDKKEPAYDFNYQRDKNLSKTDPDIIDIITTSCNNASEKLISQSDHYTHAGLSSRRSLNIPPTTTTSRTGSDRVVTNINQLKRQPLSTSKSELSASLTLSGAPPRRTSTTINEDRNLEDQSEQEEGNSESHMAKYNGLPDDGTSVLSGRSQGQRHINGSGFNIPEVSEPAEAILDTTSESGESGTTALGKSMMQKSQRKAGLFNTTLSVAGSGTATTRNSSRTSSFGNGLNFYSHLEGRKSLFTGPGHINSHQLNNSTLSLTSLNRRQFNASIYGSTSALSDSRLLNTFSPFYKGKTTYGGAAAYNKYSTGAGASAMRITPTLIRPTSSLSSLSSSSKSLALNSNKQQFGDSSNISTTAKRILDLINDFATPLSDAKKMASNLKTLPIGAQSKSRLNENDLHTSRAMRLSQVKTPYSRPPMILQPSGNANNSCRSSPGGPLPPIKELQVPTMSQLLQMKKIQTTTEKVRNITRDTVANYETVDYSLPAADNKNAALKPLPRAGLNVETEHKQQKHTNKIKNKVSNTLRTSSASRDLQDEAPPPSVNLPTLAFPLMQSVPKFDIHFTSVSGAASSTATSSTKAGLENTATTIPSNKYMLNMQTNSPAATDKISTILENKSNNLYSTGSELKNTYFKFSKPSIVNGDGTPTHHITLSNIHSYKFSPPLEVKNFAATPKSIRTQPPQLKTTGSCVDVFRQPLALPSGTSCTFGDKFKKSVSDWDCDTCMVRNNSDNAKCVACETPRKDKGVTEKNTIAPSVNSLFGEKFKKDSTEWECDVCMLRNKEGCAKCVACEAPRKLTSSAEALTKTLPSMNIPFGAAFKPKADTWECPTCMICNKTESSKCVACETKNPGSTDVTTSAAGSKTNSNTYTYGFVLPKTTKSITPDAGFQSLVAQQKASKWECDACMTRNDSERTKCACCEQPKPGSASNENSSTPGPTFSFGATAASKFSFGFSTNTREEDLRHENAQTSKGSSTPIMGVVVSSSSPISKALPVTGIQFGFKPTGPSIVHENKKDEIDSKNSQITGFKFEATKMTAKNTEAKSSETSSSDVGEKQTSSSSITMSTTLKPTMSTPGVNFSLTPASAPVFSSVADKSSGSTITGLSSGSIKASSTTEGFLQDTDKNASTAEAKLEKKQPIEGFTFKTPAPVSTTPSGFIFGKSEGTPNPHTTTATSTSAAITVTTAAVKPMFSFGSSASISQGTATGTSGTTFAGFNFGNNTQSASTTTADKQIGAVTSTSSTTTSTNSSTTPAPNTNTFVSFGSSSSYTPTFGSTTTTTSASVNPANNSTIVSSSTNNSVVKPTFGSFSFGKAATTSSFGAFASTSSSTSSNNSSSQGQNKPVAPVLGAFSFSAATTNTSTPPVATQTFAVTTAVSSTSWPKNNFLFGAGTASTPANTTQSNQTNTGNKEVGKPPVFGAFDSGTKNASNLQSTSIFGNAAATSSNALPFGSVGGSSTGTNLFASNAAPVSSNIFGATNSGNALTPAPAFGSSPFGGGSALSSSVTPTFGSTALTGSTTLGSFRNASVNKTTTNGPEAKKPEPAFNFGSSAPSAQTTSGGFNFGSASSTSAAPKPAFNFGAATTAAPPAFNFTGSAESQNSAKPFQFGAMPPTPVFNFGGGAIETTPSAPFQFNAGSAASASSNIFAPSPTPGTQTAQQIKRKIRAPIRRTTQR